jgi:DNA processing protein
MHTLNDTERLDWLRLARSENVGPITFFRLLERFGTAAAALAALPELARRGGLAGRLKIAPPAAVESEYAALRTIGARLIARGEPDYPTLLAAIEDAPPILSLLGHSHLLKKPALAIVGARNASAAGRRMAADLARDLAAAGFLIVSGFARGIDAAAHRAALDKGTAAALAGGIDKPFPPENQEIYEALKERGALVSESPPGTPATARLFPRRNRLVSGMSHGVIVVEAAENSGSLITARLALEQGREVFAVPGSPLDPRCKGTNGLIRKGATLVQTAEDVIEAIRPQLARPLAEPRHERDEPPAMPQFPSEIEVETARHKVLECLGPTPITVDEIIRQCQVSASTVAVILLELELAGRLDRQPGKKVSIL